MTKTSLQSLTVFCMLQIGQFGQPLEHCAYGDRDGVLICLMGLGRV